MAQSASHFRPGLGPTAGLALTDFPNESGLLSDNNEAVSCREPAEVAEAEVADAEADVAEAAPELVDEGPPVAEVVASLAAKFDGRTIDEFPDYVVMGGCFGGSGQTYENAALAEDEIFDPLELEWLMVDPFDGAIISVSYLVQSTEGAPAEWQDQFRPLSPRPAGAPSTHL